MVLIEIRTADALRSISCDADETGATTIYTHTSKDVHQDHRNVVTHFVGIPLIVFAIGILLATSNKAAKPETPSPSTPTG